MEAALPIDRELAVGSELGFDLRVTDARTGTVVAWNDFTLDQETDTSKFGTLGLVESERHHRGGAGDAGDRRQQGRGLGARAAPFSTDTFVVGTSGSTARVRALWDAGHIYVYAEVTDALLSKASPNPWEQDSVEVFVDQNNGKTTTYEADDAQYRVNYENTQSFGGAGSAANFVTATRIVPGGYVVEAAIALTAVEARGRARSSASTSR